MYNGTQFQWARRSAYAVATLQRLKKCLAAGAGFDLLPSGLVVRDAIHWATRTTHFLAYFLNHIRHFLNGENTRKTKRAYELSSEQEEEARNLIFNNENGDLTVVAAAFETKDTFFFPSATFSFSLKRLAPTRYWQYIKKLAKLPDVQEFCTIMLKISAFSPSVGVERLLVV